MPTIPQFDFIGTPDRISYDEVMLREPNLLVPNKKPVGNVRVNNNNPIADSLVHVFMCNRIKTRDLVTGAIPTDTNITYKSTALGMSAEFVGSSKIEYSKQYEFNGASKITAGCVFIPHTMSSYHKLINNGHNTPFDMALRMDGTDRAYININNSSVLYSANNTISTNQKYFVCAAFDGSTQYLLVNDLWYTQSYSGTLNNTTNGFCIGDSAGGGASRPFDGVVSFGFIFSRCLNRAEMVDLEKDPYQILMPA